MGSIVHSTVCSLVFHPNGSTATSPANSASCRLIGFTPASNLRTHADGELESYLTDLPRCGLFDVVLDLHFGGFDSAGDAFRLLFDVLAHAFDFLVLLFELAAPS